MLVNANNLWDYELLDVEGQYSILFFPVDEIMVSTFEREPDLVDKLKFAFEKMVRTGLNTIKAGDIKGMVKWFKNTYDIHLSEVEAGLVFVLIQKLRMAYKDLRRYGIKLDMVGIFIISEPFDASV
jgi:hypothetical protein